MNSLSISFVFFWGGGGGGGGGGDGGTIHSSTTTLKIPRSCSVSRRGLGPVVCVIGRSVHRWMAVRCMPDPCCSVVV